MERKQQVANARTKPLCVVAHRARLLKKRDSFDRMYRATSEAWQAAAEGEYWPLFPEGHAGSLAQLVQFVQQD